MKLNREKLLNTLKAIKPGLANKEMLEQSTSFVFSKGRAYTYNDEIAISHPVARSLKGAVQAEELYKLLERYKDEELDIEITDNEFKIKSKRSSAGIALQAEITLPLDEIGKPDKWKPLPKTFKDAVKFCRYSASKDLIRPVLTCLHINGKYIEACDGFRITQYDMKIKFGNDKLLLPAEAANTLAGYDPKEYSITKGWAHFQNSDRTIFSCRTGEGNYPDLSKFLKTKGIKFEFPKELLEVLERADVFSSDGDLSQPTVKINLSKDKMTIESSNSAGWFKENIRVKYNDNPLSFKANPEFLKHMLPIIKTALILDSDKGVAKGTGVITFKGDNFIHCFTTSIPEGE